MPKKRASVGSGKVESSSAAAAGSGFPFAPAFLNQLRGEPEIPAMPSRFEADRACTADSSAKSKKRKKRSSGLAPTTELSTPMPTKNLQGNKQPTATSLQNVKRTDDNLMVKQKDMKMAAVSVPSIVGKQACPEPSHYDHGDCSVYFLSNVAEAISTGSKGAVRYLSGVADITLLKGEANVNGFHLKVGATFRIHHPVWTPAARLHFGGPAKKSQPAIRTTLQKLGVLDEQSQLQGDTAEALLGSSSSNNSSNTGTGTTCNNSSASCGCAVLIQGVSRDRQDWLLAAEDQSRYTTFIKDKEESGAALVYNDNSPPATNTTSTSGSASASTKGNSSNITDNHQPLNIKLNLCDESVASVGSAAISGSGGLLRRLAVEPLHIPPQWAKETESITKHMRSCGKTSSSSSSSSSTASGAPLQQQFPRIVICGAKGVGKSTCLKYTINRLLSKCGVVCVIDCDLGQPEFTIPGLLSIHLVCEPVLSPTHLHLQQPLLSHFIGDITSKNEPELFARALGSLYKRYEQLREEYQQRGVDNRGYNSFHLLDDGEVDSDPLPLVVNTDGNIRYMGAEIMSIVLQTVRPTHVFHLSTAKDKELPAIKEYLSQIRTTQQEQASNAADRDRDHNSEIVAEHCEVCTLEPGRLTASNQHSIDLRNLRITSYFLRHLPELKSRVRTSWGYTDTPTSSSSVGVYVRSGTLVDAQGALAMAVMGSSPLSVPLSCVTLRVLNCGVPPRLFLAAINGAIVGITVQGCDAAAEYEKIKLTHSQAGDDNDAKRAAAAVAAAEKRLTSSSSGRSNKSNELAAVTSSAAAGTGAATSITTGITLHEEGHDYDGYNSVPATSSTSRLVRLRMQKGGHKPVIVPDSSTSSGYGDNPLVDQDNILNSSEVASSEMELTEEQGGIYGASGADDDHPGNNLIESNSHPGNNLIGESNSSREASASVIEFDVRCYEEGLEDFSAPLPQCIGAGIVRAIDLEQQLLYILTPIEPAFLNACMNQPGGSACITLVRGNLQLPTTMLYAQGLPCCPYMSHEVTGEGSAAMKGRPNVKRRRSLAQ